MMIKYKIYWHPHAWTNLRTVRGVSTMIYYGVCARKFKFSINKMFLMYREVIVFWSLGAQEMWHSRKANKHETLWTQ